MVCSEKTLSSGTQIWILASVIAGYLMIFLFSIPFSRLVTFFGYICRKIYVQAVDYYCTHVHLLSLIPGRGNESPNEQI
jgi:hypothetical protein